MGLTSAVDWWQESQLRVLVISSLVAQWILFFTSACRRLSIRRWFRSFIWLAYLGSDALAIYSLATLFNRHKDGGGSRLLEVLWAPVLLMHLGGQEGITAYNLEDNELWRRHILTAFTQVTVAIYVFWKSWPGIDKWLLKASILMFIPGVLKCFVKPYALKKASINNIVSSLEPVGTVRKVDVNKFEEYVKEVRDFDIDPTGKAWWKNQGEGAVQESGAVVGGTDKSQDQKVTLEGDAESKLFVDLAFPYYFRRQKLKEFWNLEEADHVCRKLQKGLSFTFGALYTRQNLRCLTDGHEDDVPRKGHIYYIYLSKLFPSKKNLSNLFTFISIRWIRLSCLVLPLAAIGLFHRSNRKAYNEDDVKVTYALLCCTAMLEGLNFFIDNIKGWPDSVAQHSLIGLFARNKKHNKLMSIVDSFGWKDQLNRQWCLKSRLSSSSRYITGLVHQHLKAGWTDCIRDYATYRRFNGFRGQWTLELNELKNCVHLGRSLKRPFDESVLLWHIATDFCFYFSCSRGKTAQCSREMSNYMVYLLFTNPEMLLRGTRWPLVGTAYKEIEDILKGGCHTMQEKELIEGISRKLESRSHQEGFIHDAWVLAQRLQALDDEKMWKVIQGVWVEMLCFSAGRCSGYLHAKALGTGGEFLTYVWLLLSYMGMENLADRLQWEDLPSGRENEGTSPSSSTSEAPTNGAAPSTSELSRGAALHTSEFPTGTTASTSEVSASATPSTSEVCITVDQK